MKQTGFKKVFKSFGVRDFILLAMLTALSIAMKTIAGTLVRMITGPLGIPGGALAGGLYMLWLPLAIALTVKPGAALAVAALQTLIMVATGAPGSHGVWTILTYMLPALPVEILFFFRKKGYTVLHFLVAVMLANIAGTYLANLLFFRMSFYPMLFTLLAAAFSGAAGGVIGYFAYTKAEKSGLMKKHKPMPQALESIVLPSDEEGSIKIQEHSESVRSIQTNEEKGSAGDVG